VSLFESASGRKFSVEHVSEDALRAEAAQAKDGRSRSLAALKLAYARGDALSMEEAAGRFDLELTRLDDWIRRQGSTGSG
jgi:hypothetical protein